MASMPMPSTTTECVQEESCMKQLSTLCITNKASIPTVGADLKPATAEEKESATIKRNGEEREETCDCQNANVANKRKNKNAVPVKTCGLVKNNSEGNGSECDQDGIENIDRNEGTDTKEIDHRESLVRDNETGIPNLQGPITAETGAIPKTRNSNTDHVKAQPETKNFDSQISAVSMDGGIQDGDSVEIQDNPCQGQRLRLVPGSLMCELTEPVVNADSCPVQEYQDYSRYNTFKTEPVLTRGGDGGFNTSKTEPLVTRGGDGGFNVFCGGRANVRQLTLSSLSASDLVQDVGSVPSRDTNHASTSAVGNINVFPGGNLQVGSKQGVPDPASDSGFEADAVIFSAQKDSRVAFGFKRHLVEDIGCKGAVLFEDIGMNMSGYGCLETIPKRFRYTFAVVTKNLKDDKRVIRLLECLDADAWGRSWKENRIIPVWTSKDKTGCPMVFKCLQGVSYYKRKMGDAAKQMYLVCLKNQMEEVRKKSPDWERQMKQDVK